MNQNNVLAQWLADAEKLDRSMSADTLMYLKENYQFCKSLGLSDDAIVETMALPSAFIRKLRS